MSRLAGLDPRTPVIVGVAQHSQRVDRGEPALEPVDLMVLAARGAESDSGIEGAVGGVDSIRVLRQLSWRYHDPGRLVAERLGTEPRETIYTVMGGNYVQTTVNRTALDILAGRNDLVLLTGGEAWRTRTALRRLGERPEWTLQDESTTPTATYGADDPDMSHPAELARGISAPVQVYPMLDNAIRAHEGRSIDEQVALISGLWSRLSDVAAANPHAWIREATSAAALATPTTDNRMIGFPYTKRLNSNNAVEQSAALLMCSAERAESLGVPRDRWVFPHAGTDAHDHWFLSNRADLHSSPPMRVAGRVALDLAEIGVDDLAHVDLYSCFPSAVQLAAAELGLGLDRPLTVTGGMSFAGGPWNNYVMHAIASMVERLRDEPGSRGLVTGNGGFITKHAFGVYATDPPPGGSFRWAGPQAELDALPSRDVVDEHQGAVTIETYTVMHDRDGNPEAGPCALLLDDGRRAWGNVTDDGTLAEMTREEFVGRRADLANDGTVSPR